MVEAGPDGADSLSKIGHGKTKGLYMMSMERRFSAFRQRVLFEIDAMMGWDVQNHPISIESFLSHQYIYFHKLQLMFFKLFGTLGTKWTQRGDGGRS